MIFEAIVGIISGIFGGLGMGGGTVLIHLLTIFFGVEQKMAQGINLLAFVVMAVVSLCIHARNGLVETKGLFFVVLGGVVFSCGGSLLALFLPSSLLKVLFGFFLCFLAIIEIFKVFWNKK